MSVRLDPGHLRKFRRLAARLNEEDAAALLRKVVVALVSGDKERRAMLEDLYWRMDQLDSFQRVLPLTRKGTKEALGPSEGAGEGVVV
jgi:hypothetical protein